MRPFVVVSLLLSVLLIVVDARIHHSGRRRHRSMPSYPARNENSATHCGPREYHVTCGPERHCDMSCENLYSPPHCQHDKTNPKCYFPRCLCNDGFVRNAHGRCIRPSSCPNRAFDFPKPVKTGESDTSFKPPRHLRARRRHHQKKTVSNNFFW